MVFSDSLWRSAGGRGGMRKCVINRETNLQAK